MKISTSIVCTLLTVAVATAATAQSPALVEPGTRLRVLLVDGRVRAVVGEFVDAGAADVAIRTPEHVVRIPFDNIASLERSIDRTRHPVEGALAGAVIGAVIGLYVGPRGTAVSVPARDPSTCPLQPNTNPQCAYRTRARLSPAGAGYGALVGGGMGFALGALIKEDTWRVLSLDALPRRVSMFKPQTAGHQFGISITF